MEDDDPCHQRKCTSNEHCCDGHVCVDTQNSGGADGGGGDVVVVVMVMMIVGMVVMAVMVVMNTFLLT